MFAILVLFFMSDNVTAFTSCRQEGIKPEHLIILWAKYRDGIFSLGHIRTNGLGLRAAETMLERRVFQKKSAHQRCSWFAQASKKHRSNREERKHSTQVYLKLIWVTSSYMEIENGTQQNLCRS